MIRPLSQWISKHLSLLLLCSISTPLLAEVTLPALISDGMVLQRDTPITLWGWANEDEVVKVKLNSKIIGKTKTQPNGKWELILPPTSLGGSHTLEIQGDNHITITDVVFGDVWLVSGQSNMDTRINRVKHTYPTDIAAAHHPLIRQFVVPREYDFNRSRDNVSHGQWQPATQDYIEQFSAVGYFFAHDLHKSLEVPIGLINSAMGGSAAEGWISESALKAFPTHYEKAQKYKNTQWLEGLIEKDTQANNAWFSTLNSRDKGKAQKWFAMGYDNFLATGKHAAAGWQTTQVPGYWADHPAFHGAELINGSMWYKKTLELPANAANKAGEIYLGTIVDADTTYINGVQVGSTSYRYPPRRYAIPSDLLREGTNTITVNITSQNNGGGFIPDKPYWLEVAGVQYSLEGEWTFAIGALTEPFPKSNFSKYGIPLGYYNAMLAPLTQTQIKGVVWYQGESNVGRAEEYKALLPTLIANWRQDFKQPNLPFIIVQLANYLEADSTLSESGWAELREAQRLTAKNTEYSELVVTLDVGEWNDIHPLRKKPVGERAALAAKYLAYNENGTVYSGPKIKCLETKDNTLTAYFNVGSSALTIKPSNATGEAKGFYVIDTQGNKHKLDGKPMGDRIEFTLAPNTKVTTLRYAWANNPTDANLINANGIPASSFEISTECPANK